VKLGVISGIQLVSNSVLQTRLNHPVIRLPLPHLRRYLFFGACTSTTVAGIGMMLNIVWDSGITALEILILALFSVTFSWISIAFWNAAFGFVLSVLRLDPLSLTPLVTTKESHGKIAGRTALVMPVHNEDPKRVMNSLTTMLCSLNRTSYGNKFDIYLLSDTTDKAIAHMEETEWRNLQKEKNHERCKLYYRRRSLNINYKVGNISDFCQRWGSHYDFMIVLDADSFMTSSAVVNLVRIMESNPSAGLIQTLPVPFRSTTLFGRVLQFAACLYSPMFAVGQSFWQTNTANYWGHNAIIRVSAFVNHCGLPALPGKPPLGGPILSHDFVEAALLRRAGWNVYLYPHINGSYEEVPSNILDYVKRDRRWTQGSLQHLRLLAASNLHFISRLHFLMGAIGYISSFLWLLLLISGTAYVLLPLLGTDLFLIDAVRFLHVWPIPSIRNAVPLLAVTIVLLFAPKFLALIFAMGTNRHLFGGPVPLLVSAMLEIVFSVVIAPLMMMYHTYFVISVLIGHDIKWEPPIREERLINWSEAFLNTIAITVVGLLWAGLTLYYSPSFFVWLTPIFTGLLLASLLVCWTSSRSFGLWSRRARLFLTASETFSSSDLLESLRPVEAESVLESTYGTARRSVLLPEKVSIMAPQTLYRRRRGLV